MTDLARWETQQRAVLADLRDKIAGVRHTVSQIAVNKSSRSGEVTVTVDAEGHVRDIQLTPQALRLGEATLAQLLMHTIKQAEADAAQQCNDATRPLTDDPRIAETMAAARAMITPTEQSAPLHPMSDAAMDSYYQRESWLT